MAEGAEVARHKEFEPELALEGAMRVFWRRGFEGASMQDLVDGMGIGKRSLYDTFGDKRALYGQVVDRYVGMNEAVQAELLSGGDEARATLRALFQSSIHDGTTQPLGCLAVNAAVESRGEDREIEAKVAGHFDRSRRAILELVERGRASGEIGAGQSSESLAGALHGAWIGLRVQARAGVRPDDLQRMVDDMMAMLD